MANYIKYGDRKLEMEGLTLEQAKSLMARHFPELADPQVNRKEEKNGDVVYTFTKKAGRKGA
jgi:PRTRC genetic system protein C